MTPHYLPRLWNALRQIVSLSVLVALLASCAFAGPAPAPPRPEPRLLDPTSPAVEAAQPAIAPAERTLVIVGLVELVDGEVWTIEGAQIRVPPAAIGSPDLGMGSLVRAVVRFPDDDDPIYEALRIELVQDVALIGEISAIDATSLILDGRVLVIPAGFVLPVGLLPGVIVRVIVIVEGGFLVIRNITLLPDAEIIGGTIELITGDIIVIGGQRFRIAPDVLIWKVRLIVGEPVRLIVVIIDGVLTIVAITIIQIIVPPPVVVVPPPIIVEPPPAPRPPAPRPPGGGGDDDDDDDDD